MDRQTDRHDMKSKFMGWGRAKLKLCIPNVLLKLTRGGGTQTNRQTVTDRFLLS